MEQDKAKKRMTFDEMRKQMNPQVQEATKAATGLGIKSVPYEQKKRFMEICDAQFNGNWGTGLAYLVSYYDDMQILMTVLNNIDVLNQRVSALEGGGVKEESKSIKLMNGVEVKAR